MPDINITTLKTILGALGYNELKPLTAESFGIIVAPTKVDKLIPELAKSFAAYHPKIISTRELRIGRFTLHAKNRNQQRGVKGLTFGRGNEHNFIGTLKEWMTDYGKPMKIHFQGEHTKFKTARITKLEHTGAKNIFMRLKADVHLVDDKGQHVPLSIKDDSAGYWESVDSYWGPKSKKFLDWALKAGETALDDNGAGGVSLRPPYRAPGVSTGGARRHLRDRHRRTGRSPHQEVHARFVRMGFQVGHARSTMHRRHHAA